MSDLKLFHLGKQDKLRYLKLIEKINPKHKDEIVLVLGEKIQDILKEGKITSIEIELINEMARFVKIFESFKNLPENIVKKFFLQCHTLLMMKMRYPTLSQNMAI